MLADGSTQKEIERLWTSGDVARFLSKSRSWVMHHRHILPPPIPPRARVALAPR